MNHGGPYRLIVIDPPWKEIGGGKIKRGADRHYQCHSREDIRDIIFSMQLEDGSLAFNPDPDGCQVWIWTTMNHIVNGFWLAEELGLTYITHRVWVKADDCTPMFSAILRFLDSVMRKSLFHKQKTWDWLERALQRGVWTLQRFGIGQYIRGSHEVALLAVNLPDGEEVLYSEEQMHEVALLCRAGRTRTSCRSIPSVLMAPRGAHSEKPAAFYDECLRISGGGPALDMFSRDLRPGYDCVGNQAGSDTWRDEEFDE